LNSTFISDLRNMLRETGDGTVRLDRRVYTDPAIFELEMTHIWEKTWVFLVHESQIRNRGDFVEAYIGRHPILVTRDRDGKVNALVNSCTHRGAKVSRLSKGNARAFSCPYHGWVFSNNGDLVGIKQEAEGGYPPSFDKSQLGLRRVPRFESYRGFWFGSLEAGIEPLADYLGEARTFIDLLDEQGPNGVEVIKGVTTYSYRGNWKLQAENGIDGYHPSTVHKNFADTQRQRAVANANGSVPRTLELIPTGPTGNAGYFDFGKGHGVMWGTFPNPEERCNHSIYPEMEQRVGATRASWSLGKLRNLFLYPSMFVMDNRGSQIRVIRPIAVDETEVTTYALAPVGESPELKRKRLRQYEDFFNPSGMATPDDLAEFEAVQQGMGPGAGAHSDMSRGARNQVQGANQHASDLGISPVSSGEACADEGILIGQYRNWVRLMTAGENSHA